MCHEILYLRSKYFWVKNVFAQFEWPNGWHLIVGRRSDCKQIGLEEERDAHVTFVQLD